MVGALAENVQPNDESLGTEGFAINDAGPCGQVTRDGLYVYMQA